MDLGLGRGLGLCTFHGFPHFEDLLFLLLGYCFK